MTRLLFLCAIVSQGQHISGTVTYEGHINQKFVDSFLTALNGKKEVSMDVKQRIINGHTNTDVDIFLLNFKNNESYYSYVEPLSTPEVYNVGSKSSKVPHYFDTKRGNVIRMSKYLGNIEKKALDWKITKETKQIGKYICYKAIASETFYSSRRGTSHNEQIIAWFTSSLPLNFGPLHYIGLPGLILELQRQKFTLRAKEIDLNPEKEVKIVRLKKNAKIINEEESRRRIKEGRG